MSDSHHDGDALDLLKAMFHDKPQLLRAVTLGDLEGQGVLSEVRTHARLFGDPVYQFTVGRTQAGKSTLGNLLFGADAMRVTGRQDTTKEVGVLPMRSDLYFFDTPGAGSDEKYENYARLALGLPQIDDDGDTVSSFELWNFGEARVEVGGTVGVQRRTITADRWEEDFAGPYPPDVLVYVVDAVKGFIRPDRTYLRHILERYGDKVVIALNWFEGRTTRTEVDNVRTQIEMVYDTVFGSAAAPRFVEFNARTGTGVHDLTRALCQVIAPEKLGGIQAVLDGDLKEHARVERGLHYRRTVHRIAARLALNTVGQDLGGKDLIAVAAGGISQLGVLTFEAEEAASALRGELAALAEREARAVRAERTETLTTKEAKTQQRDIVVHEPKFENEVVKKKHKQKITREVEEVTGKGLWDVVKVYAKSGYDQLENLVDGGSVQDREKIRARARRDSVHTTTRQVEEEIEVPVTEVRQKLAGYEKRVIDTVTEVVGFTERAVGTHALQGGLPVIQLLLGVGAGVEAYCLDGGGKTGGDGRGGGLDGHVERERQRIALALNRAEPRLVKLLAKGDEAEEEIAGLLDGLFAGTAS
ncbi:GTPase [Streptomyces sp. NPDC086091]|uniref:GTPase n=1 Tax=Streptomyces sp. NPDC086091 TaxID=3365751 RepID=UPI003815FA0F